MFLIAGSVYSFMAAVAQAKSISEKKAALCAFINAIVVGRRSDDDIVVLHWGCRAIQKDKKAFGGGPLSSSSSSSSSLT